MLAIDWLAFFLHLLTRAILYEMQRQRLKAGLYESTRLTKEAYHKLLFEFSYPEVALVFRKKSAKYPKLDDYGQIIS